MRGNEKRGLDLLESHGKRVVASSLARTIRDLPQQRAPWAHWAETWAHFLHIRSTLETVTSYGLDTSRCVLRVTPFTRDVLYPHAGAAPDENFLEWINAWIVLTATINEVARSMGQPDVYPFVLNGPAVTKLHFVSTVVAARQNAPVPPLPESLAAPGTHVTAG
jgi:hypothetical protein